MKEYCNQIDCDTFCMKFYKINTLYDLSLIPLTKRKHIKLRIDDDGKDEQAFNQLKDIENDIVEFINSGKSLFLYSSGVGNGKAQPDDALIFTDNGYISMGDIAIGDNIYGEDGNLHKVVGKFDRGTKDIYKITFSDGSCVECCDEHIWRIKDSRYKQKINDIELKDIIGKSLRRNPTKNIGWRYHIQVNSPLVFPFKEVPIDPYTLGCLLGDGCLNKSVSITNTDEDILNEIIRKLPNNIELRKKKSDPISYHFVDNTCTFSNVYCINEFNQKIRDLKLWGSNSYTKFIPDIYLFNSIEVRSEILRGLLDTDGYNHYTNRNINYTTVSKELAKGVEFIVQSLGGTCKVIEKINKYKHKDKSKDNSTIYSLNCKFPKDFIPFKCSRKLQPYLSKNQQFNPYKSIRKIDFVGKKHCYCIMTDNPSGLYLTNNLTVTHNTTWTLRMVETFFNKIWLKSELKCRVLFISVPRFLLELKSNINEKSDYIEHINNNVLDCDLVIWDDIATKLGTEFELSHLLSIIDTRINNGKSNMFTSNLSGVDLNRALGDRLYSRIQNYSDYVIELQGKDKRGIKQ